MICHQKEMKLVADCDEFLNDFDGTLITDQDEV